MLVHVTKTVGLVELWKAEWILPENWDNSRLISTGLARDLDAPDASTDKLPANFNSDVMTKDDFCSSGMWTLNPSKLNRASFNETSNNWMHSYKFIRQNKIVFNFTRRLPKTRLVSMGEKVILCFKYDTIVSPFFVRRILFKNSTSQSADSFVLIILFFLSRTNLDL